MLNSQSSQARLLLIAAVLAVLAFLTRSPQFTAALAATTAIGWLASGGSALANSAETELRRIARSAVHHHRRRRADKADRADAPRRRKHLALFEAVATRKVDKTA